MTTLTRVEHAGRTAARWQRRVWLVQTLFWPSVVVLGVVGAVIARRALKRQPSPLPTPDPADTGYTGREVANTEAVGPPLS
jgi:hypothetical protein